MRSFVYFTMGVAGYFLISLDGHLYWGRLCWQSLGLSVTGILLVLNGTGRLVGLVR